jgi:hypothetical protein
MNQLFNKLTSNLINGQVFIIIKNYFNVVGKIIFFSMIKYKVLSFF